MLYNFARDHGKNQNKTLNSLLHTILLKWMEFKIVSYLRIFKIYSLHKLQRRTDENLL